MEIYVLTDTELEDTFEKLKEEWKKATVHLSNIGKIYSHPAYIEIINLGPRVVMLIFRDMLKGPEHWFEALRQLVGDDPVPIEDTGNLYAMTRWWLAWAKEKGYFPKDFNPADHMREILKGDLQKHIDWFEKKYDISTAEFLIKYDSGKIKPAPWFDLWQRAAKELDAINA